MLILLGLTASIDSTVPTRSVRSIDRPALATTRIVRAGSASRLQWEDTPRERRRTVVIDEIEGAKLLIHLIEFE